MGRARQRKRLRHAIEAKLYQRLADVPLPPSKTYVDDAGRSFTHREAPSLVWEPMRQNGTIPLGNGEEAEHWLNRWYTCSVRRYPCGFPIDNAPYAIIGWTHVSEQAIHDFRDAQCIKNDVCGEEWEGLELYPSESRLVDPSNRFYLWCVPPGLVRWGLDVPGRRVLTMRDSIAPQRPWPQEEAPRDASP